MKQSFIACVAGKSGGHIIPCLSYAHTLLKPQEKIIFFSNNTPLDYQIIKQESAVTIHHALPLKMRSSLLGIMHTLYQGIYAFMQAFITFIRHRPRIVISTGGIEALPILTASWICGIPSILFELNAVPGKSSYWCAPFATTILVCFKEAASYFKSSKTKYEPYPLKEDILAYTPNQKSENRSKKTILILGGSQGSIGLNTILKHYILDNPSFVQKNIRIIHQTGAQDLTDWSWWYHNHTIEATHFPFSHNLTPFYDQADLVMTRAGAGSLFEIIYFKKKAILIPLITTQTDHQKDNANAIAKEYPQNCVVLNEKETINNTQLLKKAIDTLLFS